MNNTTSGKQEYITPADNKKVIDGLILKNAALNERILPTGEWALANETVYEELRLDSEELALWIMKRVSEFAKFRTQKEDEKESKKRKIIKVTEEDLDNAWYSVQKEKNEL